MGFVKEVVKRQSFMWCDCVRGVGRVYEGGSWVVEFHFSLEEGCCKEGGGGHRVGQDGARVRSGDLRSGFVFHPGKAY